MNKQPSPVLVLILCILTLVGCSASHSSQKYGKLTKPVLEVPDLKDNLINFYDIPGRGTLVYFWTTYHPHLSDLKLLQELYDKHQDTDITILSFACYAGTPEQITALMESQNFTFPVLLCDEEIRTEYNVGTFPATFLLDEKKEVLASWYCGKLDLLYWESQLANLL